jgi:hypothetical protein
MADRQSTESPALLGTVGDYGIVSHFSAPLFRQVETGWFRCEDGRISDASEYVRAVISYV